MEDIAVRAERDKDMMFECLDSVDIDSLESDGLTIRVGGKVLKLNVVSTTPIPEVAEITGVMLKMPLIPVVEVTKLKGAAFRSMLNVAVLPVVVVFRIVKIPALLYTCPY